MPTIRERSGKFHVQVRDGRLPNPYSQLPRCADQAQRWAKTSKPG